MAARHFRALCDEIKTNMLYYNANHHRADVHIRQHEDIQVERESGHKPTCPSDLEYAVAGKSPALVSWRPRGHDNKPSNS